MKEQAMAENLRLQTGFNAGKYQYRYFICIMVISILFVGSLIASPLFAAVTNAQQASIASGVAAGTDVSVILKNAVADGMTVDQAVTEMVKAGADPGRIVYEGIAAGYPSVDMVKAAAAAALNKYCPDGTVTTTTCSSQMSAIVTAARQAGASPGDINGWLAGAGAHAPLIASANTQSSQTPGPAEGYTAPAAQTALTSIVGGGGGAIGGSSIGSPTKPASQSK